MTGDPEVDEINADYGRPSWSEVASVLALALRLRTGAAGGSARSQAFGRAVRLFVLMGLLVHAGGGLADIGFRLWLAGRLSFLPAPPPGWTVGPPENFWYRIVSLGWLAWLVAYLAILLGRWAVARAVAVLAVAVHVASVISQAVTYGPGQVATMTWCFLAGELVVVAGLTAYHRDTVRPPARPWLIALAVVAALLSTMFLVIPSGAYWPLALDWPALCCLAYLGTSAWQTLRPGAGRADWGYALALLAPIVFALRVASTADYLGLPDVPHRPVLVAIGCGQALLVAFAGIALAVRTARAMRTLPGFTVHIGQ